MFITLPFPVFKYNFKRKLLIQRQIHLTRGHYVQKIVANINYPGTAICVTFNYKKF